MERNGDRLGHKLHEIACVGKDGKTRTFVFEELALTSGMAVNEYYIEVRNQRDEPRYFELRLVQKSDGNYQVRSITHNHHEIYRAKGIPDTLLPYLPSVLGAQVCSASKSPEWSRSEMIQRNECATTMWRRLERKGLAEYLPAEDIFRTNGKL